jgi:hypothetical protein
MNPTKSPILIIIAWTICSTSLPADEDGHVRAVIVEPTRTPAEQRNGVTWVLAIGVEQYRNVTPLAFTCDDAALFARAFREVGNIPPTRVHLIAPGEDRARPLQDDSSTIKAAIERVALLALPKDTFVFYFSGHGYRDAKGQMYLATSDFDLKDPDNSSVRVEFVKDTLATCQASHRLIFIDACHSGDFDAAKRVDGRLLANQIAELAGVAVIASSTGEQVSFESSMLKQGVFTYWLVQGLRGRANTTIDAKIDVQEVFRFVNTHVPKAAREIGGIEQTPVFAAQNLTNVPTVIDLHRPDRPSVLIAAHNDVPVGDIGFDPPLIEAMAQFVAADPVTVIGRLKWILQNEQPDTAAYQAADRGLQRIDEQIRKGIIRLPTKITRTDE